MKRNKVKVKVTVPYAKSLIPVGHTEADIKTFYFDRELGRWQELNGVFTIILKTPENFLASNTFNDLQKYA